MGDKFSRIGSQPGLPYINSIYNLSGTCLDRHARRESAIGFLGLSVRIEYNGRRIAATATASRPRSDVIAVVAFLLHVAITAVSYFPDLGS